MKIRYIAIALTCAIAPVTAHAQERFVGGPRIGIIVGWDDVSHESDRLDFDESWSGTGYGIVTGYNWAIGEDAIFGIGTSTMFSDHKKTITNAAGDRLKLETGRDLELSARLGYIIADAALLYAKLGYANAEVKAERITFATGVKEKDDEKGSGVRLGVGTEIPLFGSVSLLGEYRYTNYGSGFSRNQVVGGLGIAF
jgi:outer membrane immunogenic protein